MSSHDRLVAQLTAAGQVPAAWADAVATVDRGLFIPARCWVTDEHGQPQPIDRTREPDRWRAAVYRDQAVITQLDDGATSWPQTSRLATSSASQPSLVLAMLDACDIHSGHRVLEIGTGTGYHAALLAAHLGEDQVTTLEIDPVLAGQARTALTAAGYRPAVCCADGADGHPAGAPYDRIIATAAVRTLPYRRVHAPACPATSVRPCLPDRRPHRAHHRRRADQHHRATG